MSADTVTVTIKGVPYYFNGDELTSPMQEAALFLIEKDKEEGVF